MKGKILTLIIGILIGAILATAGFLIYNKINTNSNNNVREMRDGQMQRGQRPDGEIPNGEKPDGVPTKMPSNSTTDNSI